MQENDGRREQREGDETQQEPLWSYTTVWRRVLHKIVHIVRCRANDTHKLYLPFLTTGLQEKTGDSPRMALSAVTVSPLESAHCTRNESLNHTTWSSEQATQPPVESREQHRYIYLSLLICILGVIRNGLLMLFLIFYVKRKPFTVYILHLVIADFMVLCTSILQLIILLCDRLNDDTLLKYIIFLILFGYNTGLHLLTVISVERCLSALPKLVPVPTPKAPICCSLHSAVGTFSSCVWIRKLLLHPGR